MSTLALGISAINLFKDIPPNCVNMRSFWEHSVACGVYARMLAFAGQQRVPAVLTNAVRHLTPQQAPVVDVLDALRRLVPLDPRHLDRANAQGYLKDTAEMQVVAGAVAGAAGYGRTVAHRLLGATRELADSCRLDPAADLGIGSTGTRSGPRPPPPRPSSPTGCCGTGARRCWMPGT